MANQEPPDPTSNYLSKYLLDFNRRELDKFLHPEKFPKVVLSTAVLGVVAFLFVAWIFPMKDTLLNQQYQKNPASADDEREIQNLTLMGPQTVKLGEEIRLIIGVRSDKNAGINLKGTVKYPKEYIEVKSVKSLNGDNKVAKIEEDTVKFEQIFDPALQTSGALQEVLLVVFKAVKPGRAHFVFEERDTIFKNSEYQIIPLWKNNYSLLII